MRRSHFTCLPNKIHSTNVVCSDWFQTLLQTFLLYTAHRTKKKFSHLPELQEEGHPPISPSVRPKTHHSTQRSPGPSSPP